MGKLSRLSLPVTDVMHGRVLQEGACKLSVACMQDWNQHGVARMCHMLTVLQPSLASLEGSSSSDAAKQFDKARLYFSLLLYSPEGLQRAITDKPGRFTLQEYTALLQVRPNGGAQSSHVACPR